MLEAKATVRTDGDYWVALQFKQVIVQTDGLVSNMDCHTTLFYLPAGESMLVPNMVKRLGDLLRVIERRGGLFPPDFVGVGRFNEHYSLSRLAMLDIVVYGQLHSTLHRLSHDVLQMAPGLKSRRKAVLRTVQVCVRSYIRVARRRRKGETLCRRRAPLRTCVLA